jgi:periplasmic divalent cation tolerance protein
MTTHLVVLITAGSAEEATAIARALVEERLAACTNVVPGIRSIYRWEGAVHDDPEVLLVVKTRANRFEALARRVEELHSYDVPEVIALPLMAGATRYLAWLDEAVDTGSGTACS